MGFAPQLSWFWLPVFILAQGFWSFGSALVLSACVPFVPDLKILIQHGLIVLMFSSGLTFDIQDVSPNIYDWLKWNPCAIMMDQLRAIMLGDGDVSLLLLCALGGLGVVNMSLGLWMLKNFDGEYAKIST
jgi:lipopolysaccharide transport system permease protein